jgi:hypothetical protein
VADPGRHRDAHARAVATAAVLAVPLALLIGGAGTPANAKISAFPQYIVGRTVTIPQVITGMTVDSYGARR